jgi:polysaccharide export outer membrane protein
VNDELEIVYFLSREKTSQPYQFAVADKIRVESLTDATVNREVEIQPDGFIALPQIGEVLAAGKTVKELRDTVQQLYTTVQRNPQITITPVLFNVVLQDIVNAVDRRAGIGGQSQPVRVTPEGTLQVPGLRSIYVQGLTLDELKRELEVRYRASYGPGLNITPILIKRAPTYVFVGGEVRSPGRYSLEGPTTVMQAIALAGGWNVGGNTNQVVVFRRDDNWCLKATKINLFRPLYGKDPCPVNDVWIRDNDLVIVPKRPILVADDIIELYMTRGVYSAFPVNFFYNLSQGSVLAGSP